MKNNGKKIGIIFVILVVIIIVINIIFNVISSSDMAAPSTSCTVLVNKFNHSYFGIKNRSCSYVDCKGSTEFVSGKLTDDEYKIMIKEVKDNPFENNACLYF